MKTFSLIRSHCRSQIVHTQDEQHSNTQPTHRQRKRREQTSRGFILRPCERPCGKVAMYGSEAKRGSSPPQQKQGGELPGLQGVKGRPGNSPKPRVLLQAGTVSHNSVKMSSRPLEHLVLLSISTTGSYEDGEEASTVLLAWLIHNVSNNKVTLYSFVLTKHT